MTTRSLLTVPQLVKKHPAFKNGGIRDLIFKEHENGFHKVVKRIGGKILIDEDLFFKWIDEINK